MKYFSDVSKNWKAVDTYKLQSMALSLKIVSLSDFLGVTSSAASSQQRKHIHRAISSFYMHQQKLRWLQVQFCKAEENNFASDLFLIVNVGYQ